MTKDDILRFIEEIHSKLAVLHWAVDQLSNTKQASQAGPLSEPGRENTALARSRIVQVVDKTQLHSVVTKSFEEMNIRGERLTLLLTSHTPRTLECSRATLRLYISMKSRQYITARGDSGPTSESEFPRKISPKPDVGQRG